MNTSAIDYKQEVDRILREGLRKKIDEKTIVIRIIGLITEVKKTQQVSVKEYESLISDAKEQIRLARRQVIKSISGAS